MNRQAVICNCFGKFCKIFWEISEIVGNKAKGRISKRVFPESKACQNFRKNKHFLPPDTHRHACVSGGQKCLFFGNLVCFAFLKHPF